MAKTTARKANIEPSMPRVVGRQQHKAMSKQEHLKITTRERAQFLC